MKYYFRHLHLICVVRYLITSEQRYAECIVGEKNSEDRSTFDEVTKLYETRWWPIVCGSPGMLRL